MIKKSTYIFIIIVISYIAIKNTTQIDPVIDSSTIQDVEPMEQKYKEQTPPTYKIDKGIEKSLKPKEINLGEKNTSKEIIDEPKVQNKQKKKMVNSKSKESNEPIKTEENYEEPMKKQKEPEIIIEQPKLKGPQNIRTDFEQIHPNDFTNHAGGHMYYYATFYDYNEALDTGWSPADKFGFSGYTILQEDVDIWYYYLFESDRR